MAVGNSKRVAVRSGNRDRTGPFMVSNRRRLVRRRLDGDEIQMSEAEVKKKKPRAVRPKKDKSKQEVKILDDTFTLVAADLSMNYPGFCAMQVKKINGVWRITRFKVTSVKRSPKDKTHGEALITIGSCLKDILGICEPNFLVREKALIGQRGGFIAQNQMTIFKVVGLVDMLTTIWWNRFPDEAKEYRVNEWEEIAATSVKKLLTGQGRAEKDEVADWVMKYLKANCDAELEEEPFGNDNESDAAAVAVAWLISKGIIAPIKAEEKEKCGQCTQLDSIPSKSD